MLALFPDGIRRMSAPYRSLGQRSVYVSFVVISQTGQTWAQFLFPLQDVKKVRLLCRRGSTLQI